MHASTLLHRLIKEASSMHTKRLCSLLEVSNSLFNQGKLSLSSLGRHMIGKAKVKHKIKKVDRLLGNGQLYQERKDCYKAMAKLAIGGRKEIRVIVDWSPCAEHDNQILKASLALKHRSITLYEEVHPEKSLGKYSVHKAFLALLKEILPEGVQVLIITDAGFRTEWFQLVLKQGWDFEGRIRTKMMYSKDDGDNWEACKSLYKEATNKAKYIGHVLLTKASKLPCEMYLYKEPASKKKNRNRRNKTGKMVEIYKQSHRDPWLLVTSISTNKQKASWVINRYKSRMKIEHEFRDMKDAKWGIGLRYTKTSNPMRLEILLLIAAITLFQLWLIGLYAEKNNWQYSYQANTVRAYRVLSLVYLAMQIILHEPEKIIQENLENFLKEMELNDD